MSFLKKKKAKNHKEIDEENLKNLELFEYIEGNYNELGHNSYYLRVPGGIIRTIVNTESTSQIFIPLPNSFFTV